MKAGEPFTPGVKSFDYSLQLGIGVRNFPGAPPEPKGKAFAAPIAAVPPGFNPRAGEIDPSHPADGSGPDPERRGPRLPTDSSPRPVPVGGNTTLWVVVAALLAVILVVLIVIRTKWTQPPATPRT